MMGQKDYGERMYYNVSLEKLVPQDDYYRKVEQLIDFNFIRPLCKSFYGNKGQASIDPVVFFKTEMIGYFEDIVSDRRLVREISDRLSLRRFVKYDIDEEFVWHSTISRTRRLIPEKIYRKIFEEILRKCVESGLVEGEHIVVDTALIKANASMESLERKRPNLSVLEYRERALTSNPDEGVSRGDVSGISSVSNSDIGGKCGKKSDKAKKKKIKNTEWESKSDPDARVATKPGKPVDMYYKDAIAVDPKTNIVVGVEGVTADVADQQVFEPVVDAAIDNLHNMGIEPRNVIGDSGFYCGENLKTAEEKGLDAFIPEQGRESHADKYGIDDFTHDPETDEYICPAGQKLSFKGTKTARGKKSRKYAAHADVCASCALRDKCTKAKNGRVLYVSEYQEKYEAHRKKMTPYMRRRMERLRRGSVEPVFGEAINHCGLRRVNTRGIASANKKFIMCAAVQNLKKLIKYGGNLHRNAAEGIEMLVKQTQNEVAKVFTFFSDNRISCRLFQITHSYLRT